MVEMYRTWQGWGIRRKDGNRWLYVGGYYNGEFKWVTDYLYAKKYKSKDIAIKRVREINKRYSDEPKYCKCPCCTNGDKIKMRKRDGFWWAECPQCRNEFWVAHIRGGIKHEMDN